MKVSKVIFVTVSHLILWSLMAGSATGQTTLAPSDAPVASPTDTPVTTSPTDAPSASPTDAPVASPPSCEDSPLPVLNYGTCDAVVEAEKCGVKKFWTHCRASCSKCDNCADSTQKLTVSSKITFSWVHKKKEKTITKNKKKFKCKQVKKALNTDDICAESTDVALSCPKTCGVCGAATE